MRKTIIISGPTASGKSSLAMELAIKYNGVVINADSMQIYKEIPIISAWPLEEMKSVTHLLYGSLSASEICSVGRYLELAEKAISDVRLSNKVPIIVGGTGLYLKSLIYGIAQVEDIDPEIRDHTRKTYSELGAEEFYLLLLSKDPKSSIFNKLDKQRVMRAYEVFTQTGQSITNLHKNMSSPILSSDNLIQIGLTPDRDILYNNINIRFLQMIDNGAIDEVKALNLLTMDEHLPARKAHGVPQLTSYLEGKISLEDAISNAQQLSRNYAKRQITWINHQMPEMVKLSYQDYNQMVVKCFELIG